MPTNTDQFICAILAAGHGRRMGHSDMPKACTPVAGRAALVRVLDACRGAGLCRFVVVVGQHAEKVMRTVSGTHPGISFVFQAEQLGTGHAAGIAVGALEGACPDTPLVVTMGDKVPTPNVIRRLLEAETASGADVLIGVLPKTPTTPAGRVVLDDDGQFLGIVEVPDIAAAQSNGHTLELAGRQFTAEEVERLGTTVNASLYVFRLGAIRAALHHLTPDNEQCELYLTDAPAVIARTGCVETFLIPDPEELPTFNTPEELAEVERIVRRRQRETADAVTPRR